MENANSAATLLEYVILIGILSMVLFVTIRILNQRMSQQFSTLGSNIS